MANPERVIYVAAEVVVEVEGQIVTILLGAGTEAQAGKVIGVVSATGLQGDVLGQCHRATKAPRL